MKHGEEAGALHPGAPWIRIPSPCSLSGSGNRDEDAEARKFKKQAAPTNPVRTHDESGRPPTACPRRSARFSVRHPEHPTVHDDADQECKVRGNQSTMLTVRRSARLQQGDRSLTKPLVKKESYHTPLLPRTPSRQNVAHNIKTQNAVKKDKKQENPARSSQRSASAKASARMKKHKELPTVYEASQDVPARRKAADASCKNSEMQEPKPTCCEERKRGTTRKPSSKKQNHQKLSGIKEGVQLQLCASDDWTEEQDLILRQACFTARPTPRYWKKVSKMVPGKSAEDCFNRVSADLKTPSPIAPRPRSKTQFSPLGHFTVSHPKLPNLLEPLGGRKRTAKQKSLVAQKTVRHLLKKHSLMDQAQEADYFSIFETSPLNIPLEDSPGIPDNYLKSCSLHKYSVSSSARKKPLSRLKTKQDEPSPTVLTPLRNPVLHERYINQLSRREGAKKPRKKAVGTNATDPGRSLLEQKAGSVKAAKSALISSAADFISQFKKLQDNSLAHVLENSEDDEDNSV